MRCPAARAVTGDDVLIARDPQGERVEDGFGDDEVVGIDVGGLGVPDGAVISGEVEMGDV